MRLDLWAAVADFLFCPLRVGNAGCGQENDVPCCCAVRATARALAVAGGLTQAQHSLQNTSISDLFGRLMSWCGEETKATAWSAASKRVFGSDRSLGKRVITGETASSLGWTSGHWPFTYSLRKSGRNVVVQWSDLRALAARLRRGRLGRDGRTYN